MTAARPLRVLVAALFVVSGVAAVASRGGSPARTAAPAGSRPGPERVDLGDTSSTEVPTTAPPTTVAPPTVPPTTVAPPPKPAPPKTTTTAPRLRIAGRAQVAHPAVSQALVAYQGLGTWSDVFDWSPTHTNGHPPTTANDVDGMAKAGVQTLFIQAARADDAGDVTDPDQLQPIIDRAHQLGIKVVAWYLPTLTDPGRDLQRLVAIAGLRNVDSIGVDIESRAVSDVNDRNNRLIELSAALRQRLPGEAIAAIVLPPVVLEVVNPNYWPGFPWRQIAAAYDVWMPMAYWTNRTQASGYRDAHRYTSENVTRLRADVGRTDLLVSAIGGIGDQTTIDDIQGFKQAIAETATIGGGLYDWRTTAAAAWPALAPLRR